LEAVRYKSGTSDVQDSAAVAFKSGEGVCQDQAHVFIASARAIGMPARYVSGYLYTAMPAMRQPRLVDAWLGAEIGWQSMDVTHTCPAVRNYCRLAVAATTWTPLPCAACARAAAARKMEANVLIAESALQQQ